ncbi:MAG TPA: DUF2058 domain-containing protein [Gammaproteobacteria bacterium]|nr:DUF2058 domain-containing protein [Gammaproteobacteria bacterium]
MINALQEQLLKAGLATEDQARKPRPPQTKKYSSRPKRKPSAKPRPKQKPQKQTSDLEAAYRARRRAEKAEAEAKSRQAAERKANRNKVKKLIAGHALKLDEDGVLYQFVVGKNIKKVYVTEAQRAQLIAGELAVTFLGGKRCVIPRAVADEIQSLDPQKMVVIHQPEDDSNKDYAGYEVPDDLIW